jgi:hypothetical protein
MTQQQQTERPAPTTGYWRCTTCGATFFGGGQAIHNRGCADGRKGYEACVYVKGEKKGKEKA